MAGPGVSRRCEHCSCPLLLLTKERRRVCARCQARRLEAHRQKYRDAHPDADTRRNRAYREQNREKIRQQAQAWYERCREAILERERARYRRKRGMTK